MHWPSLSHKLRIHKNYKLLKILKNFKLKFYFPTVGSKPSTPVKITKQESRDSVQSGSSSSFQQPTEDLMTQSKAPPVVDTPPSGDLRYRAPSVTS
jgi:hypothetical protein